MVDLAELLTVEISAEAVAGTDIAASTGPNPLRRISATAPAPTHGCDVEDVSAVGLTGHSAINRLKHPEATGYRLGVRAQAEVSTPVLLQFQWQRQSTSIQCDHGR